MIDFDPASDTGKVPSPCISICRMNPQTGLCEGCLRSIDEIALWSTATEEMKRQVWVEIRRRREALF
ncbi:DUF1289 domain-containing protein [Herbaspirillum sp. ST 5-3]|uniref:DUF1289 domain-containing protein n=1 Tax=Oxalobacteraceae TaxID=75682 RepID=UPI0010A4607B|nr:DUF1289 domain-containing protein [Herbaspirillum sp. ST 5-3]